MLAAHATSLDAPCVGSVALMTQIRDLTATCSTQWFQYAASQADPMKKWEAEIVALAAQFGAQWLTRKTAESAASVRGTCGHAPAPDPQMQATMRILESALMTKDAELARKSSVELSLRRQIKTLQAQVAALTATLKVQSEGQS